MKTRFAVALGTAARGNQWAHEGISTLSTCGTGILCKVEAKTGTGPATVRVYSKSTTVSAFTSFRVLGRCIMFALPRAIRTFPIILSEGEGEIQVLASLESDATLTTLVDSGGAGKNWEVLVSCLPEES